jgi:hypothetical protein
VLRVAPRPGLAVVFPSAYPDGLPDPHTWHAGCPPTAGVKTTLQFFVTLPRVNGEWVYAAARGGGGSAGWVTKGAGDADAHDEIVDSDGDDVMDISDAFPADPQRWAAAAGEGEEGAGEAEGEAKGEAAGREGGGLAGEGTAGGPERALAAADKLFRSKSYAEGAAALSTAIDAARAAAAPAAGLVAMLRKRGDAHLKLRRYEAALADHMETTALAPADSKGWFK